MDTERRAKALIVLVILLSLILSIPAKSRAATTDSIFDGFWEQIVESAGDPRIVIELDVTDAGDMDGTVHTFTGLIKEEEFDIGQIAISNHLLRFAISPFPVRFEGTVEPDGERMEGKLLNPDDSEQPFTLRKIDPVTMVGLHPRPIGESYSYAQPPQVDDGWQTRSLEDTEMDQASIHEAMSRIINGDCGLMNALLVVKNGALVVEEYFYGYDRETLHLISSNTKSICSLLIGIAIDKGQIADLDTPIFSFLPSYESLRNDRSAKITLRHLLTMTAGFELSGMIMEETDDRLRTALERKVIHEPGTVFQYDEGSANLLAGIIKHATGHHADVFARSYLFEPLGIETYAWEEEKQNGYPCCQGSLELRPRDMAKIGQLVLNGGTWNGTRIVSEEWILESTTAHARDDYGYMWWRGVSDLNGVNVESIVATGLGSQFICIFPDLDAIVVLTGSNYHNDMTSEPIRVLEPLILKALVP